MTGLLVKRDEGVVVLTEAKTCDGSKSPCWTSTLLHVSIVISLLGAKKNNR